MGRLILSLISGAVVLVLTAVMVIALGAPGSQAADLNLLTALEEPGEITDFQPIPPVPTLPPTPVPTASPTPLGPIPPAINGPVGGIVDLLGTDDGPATASETGGDTIYVVALAGVIGAILIAGGWYAGRRWLA